MTRTLRRLWAVFLCLLLALSLATLMEWSFVRQAISQHAACVPADRFAESLEAQEQFASATLLTPRQTQGYIEAAFGARPDDDAAMIVVVATGGRIALMPVLDGLYCIAWGLVTISPESHERGSRAAYGLPI